MSAPVLWEAAEIGRLLYTHALNPVLVAAPLAIDAGEAHALVEGVTRSVSVDRQPKAALMLNILVRIELRCGDDPVAIRLALDRPLDMLAGASIAERLMNAATAGDLLVLRDAAGAMPVIRIKMWRVADRYS